MQLRAPFAWIGGKSKLADDIVAMMPEHRLYVEVFGGALNVLYRKPKPVTARQTEVVNDVNGELVNLHRVIKQRPESLSMYLREMLISREMFEGIKSGRLKPRNDIERAAFYYYIISQSFGSKGTSFAMNAKSRRPKDIYKSFNKWSERLKFVTIEHMSFEKLIEIYDRPGALFYCDPPYVSTEKHYSHCQFGIKEHELLASMLRKIEGEFLLSYNDCELIRELYKGFEIVQTQEINYTLASRSNKRVREVFIKNH